jgi:hypothetical protein
MSNCRITDPVPYIRNPGQPIYPYTVASTPLNVCNVRVLPGHAVCFPFHLCPGKAVTICDMHAIPVGRQQDHSLRAWISREPIGMTVFYSPPTLSFWHPDRHPAGAVTVYDAFTEPTTPPTIGGPLIPGGYFLNVLNLINSDNEISLRFVESQIT